MIPEQKAEAVHLRSKFVRETSLVSERWLGLNQAEELMEDNSQHYLQTGASTRISVCLASTRMLRNMQTHTYHTKIEKQGEECLRKTPNANLWPLHTFAHVHMCNLVEEFS